MNDLKTEMKERVEIYLADQLNKLYLAYSQDIDIANFEKVVYLINSELLKQNNLGRNNLDKTFDELIKNYTLYRRMCASAYLTAYAKVNKK